MEKHTQPFLHFVQDEFLNTNVFEKVKKIHVNCMFNEKHTDLFRFLQTDDLKSRDDLEEFRSCVMDALSEVVDTKGGWIDLFGSYYRAGDYLLCHDDRTEHRKYAFVYYLEDHASGSLILYENDAMSVSKKIDVRANRLIVFEVSEISFHEVEYCEENGRRTFTGWLSFEDVSMHEELPVINMNVPRNQDVFSLDIDFESSTIVFYPGMEYDFGSVDKHVEGPFYSRRVERLVVQQMVVPEVDGWVLFDAGIYHFRVGDYILLNDRCNSISDGVCDVYFMEIRNDQFSCKLSNYECNEFNKNISNDDCNGLNNSQSNDECDLDFSNPSNPIKYLDSEGRCVYGIPIKNKSMFAINRCGLSIFVQRCTQEFHLAHFIYMQKNTE
ncbi:Prolyl 3-hydroxylase ogfod1 [Ordospora colligata]|uniref:Prolyl 3,4-dihydroxylase TPA1/OFD1 N-terminal domain-containing protein n=1 Tax=Ordospora colligata OC4 TaxID=1354746 RepID=A0A0B2UE35_9MICR|nr:uncharacterized protein M896_080660 [Ordospora colligata OC4]KHN69331.1 hypothetical protein M896_080660 [Ordospora colligata OC4]TBU14845.1 hypothetical protein CWI41_080650 [Ordospora colligata]TBU14976.1 hypothetical protein CWI40_080670 [Ordospora colligata]